MKTDVLSLLVENPVVAAVRSEDQIDAAIKSSCKVVFLLFGDLCNVADSVKRLQTKGKKVIVHIDLITGLGQKEAAVDFICKTIKADGIISTRTHLVHRASEQGFFSALRVFAIDSVVEENLTREISKARPDIVEILPGILPKYIARISRIIRTPIVTGGLISDKSDILAALGAGAVAVSASREELWEL